MKHLDLFSGIGGFALAASWVWGDEHDIHSFVEIEPFCQKVLKKHWPEVPIHSDIKDYKHDGTTIDLLTGGYPCQAFSTASHGIKIAEDLSRITTEYAYKIRSKYIIFENVQEQTVSDCAKKLRYKGYRTIVDDLDALTFGYDHKRNRWFCIAYPYNKSQFLSVYYAEMAKLQSIQNNYRQWEDYARILRISDGIPYRTHRLKALGNAIVPQVVVPIMQAIKQIEERKCQDSAK